MANEGLSDAQKEQIKLRATFLNGIGIGIILIGVFTPVTRLVYGDMQSGVNRIWLVSSPAACFLLGVALHLAATKALEKLKA
jgi:hypothetical protein